MKKRSLLWGLSGILMGLFLIVIGTLVQTGLRYNMVEFFLSAEIIENLKTVIYSNSDWFELHGFTVEQVLARGVVYAHVHHVPILITFNPPPGLDAVQAESLRLATVDLLNSLNFAFQITARFTHLGLAMLCVGVGCLLLRAEKITRARFAVTVLVFSLSLAGVWAFHHMVFLVLVGILVLMAVIRYFKGGTISPTL
jgi:hypothetical protein